MSIAVGLAKTALDRSLSISDLCGGSLNVGYIGTNGTVANTSDNNWRYTDFIEVTQGATLDYSLFGHTVIGSLCLYDASYGFLSAVSASSTNTPVSSVLTIPSNAKYIRLSFSSDVAKVSKAIYSTLLSNDVLTLKSKVKDIQATIGSKNAITYIKPYKVYTVCNDAVPSKKGHNRNHSAAIYLDHMFNGLSKELNIRFNNKLDKTTFTSPIVVTDSNETSPAVTYNNGVNVLETTKSLGVSGGDIVDGSFNVIHASTLNSVTKDVTPKILCIGDSITYGELAQVNDDDHQQNWAYHLMCKELFMKDNLDAGGGYNVMFLGHYKKTRNMTYNNTTYPVTTFHEGIRGISLNDYLNGNVADFKSGTTNKFSINAWLSKYRTLDDNGNRLALGSGTGTAITSGNINDIDVCTPTHVLIMLGANGGGTIEQYRELISIIRTEYPNMIIGITVPDAAGTYFPSLHPNCTDKMVIWNDTGAQGSRHNLLYGLADMLQTEYGNATSETNKVFFLPFYFVQPTAESCAMRKVDLPDSGIALTAKNMLNDAYGWHASTHVNGIGHLNWAYQLYSWLKYTIAKGLVV